MRIFYRILLRADDNGGHHDKKGNHCQKKETSDLRMHFGICGIRHIVGTGSITFRNFLKTIGSRVFENNWNVTWIFGNKKTNDKYRQ